ncbi:FeoB-associated Cys-rich membrane protein [Anaerotignum faecicola]|nr:FeoB-associated Cys-rich membrane protein [Anaerotignum faecicola]
MGGLNILDFILLGIVLIIVLISIRKMKKNAGGGCSGCSGCGISDCPGRKKDKRD